VAKARGKQISEVLPYKAPAAAEPAGTAEPNNAGEVTTDGESEADAGA
jgi:hypothetical protein